MKKFLKWFGIISGSLIILLIIAGFAVRWYFNSFESEFPSGGLLSENQESFDIIYYDINLKILFDEEAIKGYTVIRLQSKKNDIDKIELDLIDLYTIDSVLIKDQKVDYIHQAHKLFIFPKEDLNNSDILEIKVTYNGQPPEAKFPPWLGGFTWSEDDSGYTWIGLSCQGEGGKIWFPCKDHPSDEADSVAINITVPDDYFVAANGLLKQTTHPENGLKTYHWLTKYPINNYLVNIGVGKFIEVTDEYICNDGTKIPVVFYVLPQLEHGAVEFVQQVIRSLDSYSKFFGEFPWKNEKVGFLNTPFSGMEHQTIIAYGNNYRETFVDSFSFDPLLVHELAHEWWGNKVTVYDWADFWLHEGFATYAEALLVLDKAGEAAYHKYMRRTQQRIQNNSPIIAGENLNSSESYHIDIYSKGAAFIHTLRYVLGDSVFFPTLKQFATDSSYTYQNKVDTQDFIGLIEKNSGHDLSALFDLYLKTNDYPFIHIDSVALNTFDISIPNINFEIPMDVTFADTTKRIFLGPDALTVISSTRPVVDKKGWYLKEEVY